MHALLVPLRDVLQVFAKWTRALQSATSVTLSLLPAAVDGMLAATGVRPGDNASIATIKAQLHAAVRDRLSPLAASPRVVVARFLDPTQHRILFQLDASGAPSASAANDFEDTTAD